MFKLKFYVIPEYELFGIGGISPKEYYEWIISSFSEGLD